MIINITLHFILLIWSKILCEKVTNVSFTLDDFSTKNKRIGNVIYTATKQHKSFVNAVLVNHESLFELKNNSDLYTKVDIDRDEICFKLSCCREPICYAMLKGFFFTTGPPMIFNIRIEIVDINDNSPSFVQTHQTLTIPESAELYSTYKLPISTDADSNKYGVERYTLSDFTNTFVVIMENVEPSLKLMKPLDRETFSSYNIQLVAHDKGSPSLSSSLDIKVKISDVNDNSPYFVNSPTDYTPLRNISGSHRIKVRENQSGDVIFHLHAHDLDEGENSKIFYSISSTQSQPVDVVKQKFSLKSPHETAKIQLRQNLDYENEVERLIHLVVVATDSGRPPKSASMSLTIQLLDENDNSPIINETMSKDIKENDSNKQQLKIFSVSDKDSVSQKNVKCDLSEDLRSKFELKMYDWNLYDLTNKVAFDYEEMKEELVRIICTDHGDPEMTRSANFYVKIIDQNDNSPQWEKQMYVATVRENDYSSGILTTLTATDADSGSLGMITYTIVSVNDSNHSKFVKIDPITGTIFSDQPVDREIHRELIYHITATDNRGSSSLSSDQRVHQNTTKLVITVLDENDNSPMFMGNERYFRISESAKIGSIVGKLIFNDPDEAPNNVMLMTLTEYNSHTFSHQLCKWFGIKDDNTIVVKTTLNREEQGNVSVTVNVEDRGKPSRTVKEEITIEILDENDNAPSLWHPKNSSFISTNGIVQTTPLNTRLIKLEASDPDNGINATIRYKLVQSNFSIATTLKINQTTGEITTNWHSFEQPEIGVYFLRISIDDQGFPSLSTGVTLFVNVTNANMGISAEAYMSNIVILILIIVCSLALIVSLIAAIFWVRFRVNGDSAVNYGDENVEREHLNKEMNINHYSLMALENNFRQNSFENSNLNSLDPYSPRQQSQLLYGKTGTLPKDVTNMLDNSRLTPCEDCFNSFGTIQSQMNRYESPNIARFRSPISVDFNSPFSTTPININTKPLILQSYPVSDFGAISNIHPPNLMGEPNFSDSGKGGSVEDLNYRLPVTLSTFNSASYNTTTSFIGKQPCQNLLDDLHQKRYVQNKDSETMF